jgi:predicted RNase H-like HicB family nuclease
MMDEHRIRFLMQRGSIGAFWDLGMKKDMIVIEPTETGYSAHSPDLPGCISTGASRDQVEVNMREAIAFHLDGLREEGQPVPEPHTYSAYVELPV